VADNSANINTNAQAPAKASGDTGEVEAFPIKDQILADQYAAQAAASKKRRRGIRFAKMLAPGTVSDQGGSGAGSVGSFGAGIH
jgi:hypothetical protein